MTKKRKLTPAQQKLQQDFEKMMRQHERPLERGAKAKAVTGSATLERSRGTPMLERQRLNKEQSVDLGTHVSTAPRQTMMYSGDKMIGVALMHKSSYAPVFSSEAAQDIAKMRRG